MVICIIDLLSRFGSPVYVSFSDHRYHYYWSLATNEKLTVANLKNLLLKSALFAGTRRQTVTNTCWSRFVPSKVNLLFWKAVNCRLPTKINLFRRGIYLPNIVCTFRKAIEKHKHLLRLRYAFSKLLWDKIFK